MLWQMQVPKAANTIQEPSKVAFFGEAGQLRGVVEPDVNHALGARFAQQSKELAGGLLSEADGQHSLRHATR